MSWVSSVVVAVTWAPLPESASVQTLPPSSASSSASGSPTTISGRAEPATFPTASAVIPG